MSFNICLSKGVYIPASQHYYYPDNRYQAHFPPQSKDILTNLELLTEIEEEERVTVKLNKAKECGYTGLSIMHRLWPLYGFKYDNDLLHDEMHTVQLNIVKAAVDHLRTNEDNPVDWEEVDRRLEQFPWTSGTYILCIAAHFV